MDFLKKNPTTLLRKEMPRPNAMARVLLLLCSIFSTHSLYFRMLFLLVQLPSQLAFSASMVKFLPGFQGPLPFELETGYVGVGESEEVQLFYYFVKSERNPKEDPLLLWLTGGPGCSAWSGLVYEIGPLNFKVEEYNGSLPKLVLNPYSWTKTRPLALDFPMQEPQLLLSRATSKFKHAQQLHQFLIKWLIDHPEFVSNPVYIAGDSYSGIPGPFLVQQISNGNEEGIEQLINLQGYILGNPITDPSSDGTSAIPYAHGMGLISDELYESLKRTCGGEYLGINPRNAQCMQYVEELTECLLGINSVHILKPLCIADSPKPQVMFGKRRSLYQKLKAFLDPDPSVPQFGCQTYGYLLSRYWANDDDARKALHTRQGSIGEWQRCNSLAYKQDIASSFAYHVNLSTKGYRSLIYSGDHDIVVPFLGTQAWIRSLNYSIVDDWRPWTVQGQIAGYTRSYSNRMTFATVKGGGHTAPEYKPEECFTMFKRWTSHEPLYSPATVQS